MATAVAPNPFFAKLHEHRGMIFPISFIALLAVLLVPLPPFILDLLLVLNITIAIIVLVTTIYIKSPLEFAVFPSLLLAVTLFRLVLNVATTRLILNASGTPEEALHAAGEVVMRFSEFVTGGKMIVGVIIFVIIFIIQFVVITKGATRISEVAARFTLDAMPGKQMAIDADLNAGILTEPEARRRRSEISQEADFYGAMDGASKFVRGDAVAAIIITFINVLGGIYVGMVENGWEIWHCLELYTKLTIGDGLVSQVPAFITTLAAGLIVTRTSSKNDLGDEMLGQMLAKPKALIIAAGFLMAMSFTGLPAFPLLILGACCGGLAFVMNRSENRTIAAAAAKESEQTQAAAKEPEKVEKLLDVDTMELEVGYGLVRLVDTTKGGDLLDRISLIRRQIAVDLGIIVPPIRIRDNMQLSANDYAIKIKGQTVARGVTYPEQYMAMDNGAVSGPIPGGTQTIEPAFGLPAYWITESERGQAELLNYTVVEATAVLATHLTEVVKQHGYELLTRQEVKNLVENLKVRVPALIEEVIPTQIKPGELQKVMQNLLRERVPVRDLETIIETLGDWATRTKDLDVLTEYVRSALARTICKQYVDDADKLWCVTLDPAMEDLINSHLERSERGTTNTMPPVTAQQVVQNIAEKMNELTAMGRSAVILCSPTIRGPLRRMIETGLPHVAVLAYNEVVSDVAVEAVALVGMNG
ncbi:MAG TPA: flagellar biosynthesis protein FlhA [Tepidisphaeraceae bacterium]|jgi:flagellar biosynthesis protein FlhA|nr:flagellar biosynthesis protein FlhA [Tepidisphaeraceae bacterium]